jgi:hypothetical protein
MNARERAYAESLDEISRARYESAMAKAAEVSYRNPWHDPRDARYGPAFYTTSARPTRHAGHEIYHRHESCWDVVKDGVCVAQRAGFNGAKRAAEAAEEIARHG